MSIVFVTHPGQPKALEVEIDLKTSTGDLVREVLRTDGTSLREHLVFAENGGESLSLDVSLEENGVCDGDLLHFHPCREVAVAVTYNGQVASGEFRPADVSAKVLTWAVAWPEFRIPEPDRSKFEIRDDQNERVPDDAQIGSYVVGDRCGADFKLAEHPKAQG